jgi:hypothetical protein
MFEPIDQVINIPTHLVESGVTVVEGLLMLSRRRGEICIGVMRRRERGGEFVSFAFQRRRRIGGSGIRLLEGEAGSHSSSLIAFHLKWKRKKQM